MNMKLHTSVESYLGRVNQSPRIASHFNRLALQYFLASWVGCAKTSMIDGGFLE